MLNFHHINEIINIFKLICQEILSTANKKGEFGYSPGKLAFTLCASPPDTAVGRPDFSFTGWLPIQPHFNSLGHRHNIFQRIEQKTPLFFAGRRVLFLSKILINYLIKHSAQRKTHHKE